MDEQLARRPSGLNAGRLFSLRVALGAVIYQSERHEIPLTQAMMLAAKKFGEGTVRNALRIYPDKASIAALHTLDCLTSDTVLESPDPDRSSDWPRKG
jgi:hypothetical protein